MMMMNNTSAWQSQPNQKLFNQGLQTPQKALFQQSQVQGQGQGLGQGIPQGQNIGQGTLNFMVNPIKIKNDKDEINIRNIIAYSQFNKYSVEELRAIDIQLKKCGMVNQPQQQQQQVGGGLGLFGASQKPNAGEGLLNGGVNVIAGTTTSLFGRNGIVQQQQAQVTGVSQQQQSSIGGGGGGGLFSNSTGATTGSLFGNTTQQQPTATNITNGSSLFSNTQATTSGSSLFSKINNNPQQQQPQMTSLFGNTSTSTPQGQGLGLFGTTINPAQTQAQCQVQSQGTPQFPMTELIQQSPMGVDITQIPSVVIEAFQQQISLQQFKKNIEEKYNQEILGSHLLHNFQSSTNDNYYTQDTFTSNSNIDYVANYFKAKYNSNNSQIKAKTQSNKSKRNQLRQTFLNRLNLTTKGTKKAYSLGLYDSLLSNSTFSLHNKDNSILEESKHNTTFLDKIKLRFNDKEMYIAIPSPMTTIAQFKQDIIGLYSNDIEIGDSDINDLSLLIKNQFLIEDKYINDYNINKYSIIDIIITRSKQHKHKQKQKTISVVASDDEIPKLSLNKYTVTPDYKQLCRMTSDELRNVTGFTISNEYGQIKFLQNVNLNGVNIDNIIQLENLKVSVYDTNREGVVLPPKGSELNVAREITIKQLYISDENLEGVKETIARGDGRFISYDNATGVLMFIVE